MIRERWKRGIEDTGVRVSLREAGRRVRRGGGGFRCSGSWWCVEEEGCQWINGLGALGASCRAGGSWTGGGGGGGGRFPTEGRGCTYMLIIGMLGGGGGGHPLAHSGSASDGRADGRAGCQSL